jgi:hypothetical protein
MSVPPVCEQETEAGNDNAAAFGGLPHLRADGSD